MSMSVIYCSLVICLLLSGRSFAEHGEGAFRQYGEENDHGLLDRYRYQHQAKMTERTDDTQQALKQKMLDNLMAQLGQRETVADTEQRDPVAMLNQELVEEEAADQLTATTRYVGVGYNLLKGNPDGSLETGGADPGLLTTQAIFEFTYNDGNYAYFKDTTVQVPDQVTFQPIDTCSEVSY